MAQGPATGPDPLRVRFDELLDEYRAALLASLDGLSEEEARRSPVPSKTTLLGLVKHVTYVEAVWFGQAVDERSLPELGVASTPDRSFTLPKADTIASVQRAYRERAADSRRSTAGLRLDDEVHGRGTRSVWALYLQVRRELAHHCGHADILREQILDARQNR